MSQSSDVIAIGQVSSACACGCGERVRPGNRFLVGHGNSYRHLMDGPNPSGICMCGCNQLVGMSAKTDRKRGLVLGKSVRYIQGHAPNRVRHHLISVDAESRTGICDKCGPTHITKRKQTPSGWQCRSSERHLYYKDKQLKSDYQIELLDYMQLLVEQDNHCAVCPTEHSWEAPLMVDHDHTCCPGKTSCGKCIRGLLCERHNLALGAFHDNVHEMTAAVAYVKKGNHR